MMIHLKVATLGIVILISACAIKKVSFLESAAAVPTTTPGRTITATNAPTPTFTTIPTPEHSCEDKPLYQWQKPGHGVIEVEYPDGTFPPISQYVINIDPTSIIPLESIFTVEESTDQNVGCSYIGGNSLFSLLSETARVGETYVFTDTCKTTMGIEEIVYEMNIVGYEDKETELGTLEVLIINYSLMNTFSGSASTFYGEVWLACDYGNIYSYEEEIFGENQQLSSRYELLEYTITE